MPELRKYKFVRDDIVTPVSYVIFHNFLVFSTPTETPVEHLILDIMEELDLEEWTNLWGKPALCFYRLITCAEGFDLAPGHFELHRVGRRSDPQGKIYIHHFPLRCPSIVVKLFAAIVGKEPFTQRAFLQQTFDEYEQRMETQPNELVDWLDKQLLGSRISARKDNHSGHVMFGRQIEQTLRWRSFIEFAPNDLPSPQEEERVGHFLRYIVKSVYELEKKLEEHTSFLYWVQHAEDDPLD